MMYKIGNKVHLKSYKKIEELNISDTFEGFETASKNQERGTICFNNKMKKYCGKNYTIHSICNGTYEFNEVEDNWKFIDEWLEPVKKVVNK